MEIDEMRRIAMALALTLGMTVAATAAAQESCPAGGTCPMHGEHADMMSPDHVQMMRAELGLTDAQTARIAELHARLAESMRAHCAQVHAAGGPNAQTHQAMHGQMTAAMENAHREAMAVLTDAQRARMDSLHAQHHAGHAPEPGEHAQHHGDAGHDMAAMHADSAAMARMHAGMCGAPARPRS
jgi:hypothetical protein